jgi:hypothetical protein
MNISSLPARIDLSVEVPEELHESMKQYLDAHPEWSQNRVISAALSLFLMQNGHCNRQVNQTYLNMTFDYES